MQATDRLAAARRRALALALRTDGLDYGRIAATAAPYSSTRSVVRCGKRAASGTTASSASCTPGGSRHEYRSRPGGDIQS